LFHICSDLKQRLALPRILSWAAVSALLDFGGFALSQVTPGGKYARHISLAVLLDGSFVVYVNSVYASMG
jgi:hypothetical protein